MKVLRVLLGAWEALLVFIGICLVGLLIGSGLSAPFDWIVAVLTVVVAIFLSTTVYKMIIRRGYLSTISGNESSYELDHLKPTPGSGVSELTPEELEHYFDHEKLPIKMGNISIWGDWQGRKLNEKHKISTIEFNSDKNILHIYFTGFCELQVKNPAIIHCTESYLKIMKAKEIKWEILNEQNEKEQFNYLNTGKKIITKSNTDWKPKKEDLGIGMNAVYIQG